MVDVDTADLHRLTDDPGYEQYPAWSPDGRSIVFTQSGSHYGDDIYIMNADGSDLHLLVADAWGYGPVWSHDGRQIAFTTPSDVIQVSMSWTPMGRMCTI
ncbi:MAG: PD40 domain-containing protein [Anaerolineaceae bacterium]|nr:PD40 domain-containing protein [Anaerolineaceae bacterium]